ncbi:hydrolase [Galactobacter valiniphilus]|uniref:Hydrolase n=1 Tax=Galactobacter valiniphilus TaxID=2676122 RepID=A0A399JAD5_9MICC|nr:zinc-dependent metalloprotease [Galactobacter valiniphilus]RII40982.1 hydrolase [Galactobacter valiniphilus]
MNASALPPTAAASAATLAPSASGTAAPAATGPGGLVRWGVAASTARTLASAGPRLEPGEGARIVEEIRAAAAAGVEHVYRITGLESAHELRDSEVLVVDRAGWATAAVNGFREMLEPGLKQVLGDRFPQGLPMSLKLGGYGVGAEMGGLVTFLASHVLGQYDAFSVSSTAPGGRLLLVAPNIVQVERALSVEPADFRLWVALHEQTHRVQFAAAPWLREYLREQITELMDGLMSLPTSLRERLKSLTGSVRQDAEAPQGGAGQDPAHDGGGMGLLDLVTGPREKEALSRVTAVMSLLEGHANVVMDSVDASVVPTVKTIRQRFEGRGTERSALQKLIMRVIGMAAKQKQYQDGARFVRAAVDELGMEGFNAVWRGREMLPTEAELHEPRLWVERVSADA